MLYPIKHRNLLVMFSSIMFESPPYVTMSAVFIEDMILTDDNFCGAPWGSRGEESRTVSNIMWESPNIIDPEDH